MNIWHDESQKKEKRCKNTQKIHVSYKSHDTPRRHKYKQKPYVQRVISKYVGKHIKSNKKNNKYRFIQTFIHSRED